MLKLKGVDLHTLQVRVRCTAEDVDRLYARATPRRPGSRTYRCRLDDLLDAHVRASGGRLTEASEADGGHDGEGTLVLVLSGPEPLTRADAVAVVYALNKGLEAI